MLQILQTLRRSPTLALNTGEQLSGSDVFSELAASIDEFLIQSVKASQTHLFSTPWVITVNNNKSLNNSIDVHSTQQFMKEYVGIRKRFP